MPEPKTKEEEENLKEINGYFKGKHIPALTLLSEMASFLQNMLEDAYVEQKMCRMYPGSIRRGILQNRVRRAERIPSLKVQLESGYDPAAILLNLMTQYSLLGTVNNWEGETGELLSLLETVKPVIDLAADVESAEIRMAAVNRILLVIWKVLAEKIRKMEKQQDPPSDGKERQPECQDGTSDGKEKQQERQDEPSDEKQNQQKQQGESQSGSSDGQENQNVLEEMMEEFQGQIPEYLLEKDSKDAAGKRQDTVSKKAVPSQMEISRLTECEFEAGELLMEHIQELADTYGIWLRNI